VSQQPVFVIVSGGVVQETPSFVEVIDFDNLLSDCWTAGDTETEWNNLSEAARDYVKALYPEDYERIQLRIEADHVEARHD
jgi:hypothetical protein